jgi:hypothetical protein
MDDPGDLIDGAAIEPLLASVFKAHVGADALEPE